MVYQDTLGKPHEARDAFRTALELEEQAAARAPYDVWVQDFMAKHIYCLGVVHDGLSGRAVPRVSRSRWTDRQTSQEAVRTCDV